MNMMSLFIFAFLLFAKDLCPSYAARPVDWNYDSDWVKKYPICGSKSQSPIALWREDITVDPNLPDLQLTHYETPIAQGTITNKGYSIKIDEFADHPTLSIRGAKLTAEYELTQLHFHWADNNRRGSEHTYGNEALPLEMHLVHVKKGLPFVDALNMSDGLAVIGVHFQLVPNDNEELNHIVKLMPRVKYFDTKVKLEHPITVHKLLPDGAPDDYITYKGSLTTPSCYESVQWHLFYELNTVSERQLKEFRSLLSSAEGAKEEKFKHTYRKVQPLNNRTIYSPRRLFLPSKNSSDGYDLSFSTKFTVLFLIFYSLISRN